MENEFEVLVPLSYLENLIRENQMLKEKLNDSESTPRWEIVQENGNYIAKELSKIQWDRCISYK